MPKIEQKHLPIGKRRSGQKILGIKFIVCHDTGNPNSTAMGNVNYYSQSFNEAEQSAHSFVDDSGVIECVPQNEKAWHVRRNVLTDNNLFGVDANDYALGIELCYFPNDLQRSKTAYNNYVEYIKGLCAKYGLNANLNLVGHYKLDPDRRTDPLNAFKYVNKTWEDFIQDVSIPVAETPKSIILKRLAELTKLVENL